MPTIWPFPPRDGMTEGLEFSTDILRAFSTEQRIRRTDIPRRRFSCSYAWTERVYETARALMRSTHPGPFEIPDWAMWQKITVEAGTSLIPVDTSAAKYVDRLIIMDRYDAYEAFDIVSVTDAGVTIDGAVSRRFRDATVAPLIEAYAMQGLSAPRPADPFLDADVEWVNFTGPDLVAEATLQELGRRTIATVDDTGEQGSSDNEIVTFDRAEVNELNAWSAGVPDKLVIEPGVGPVQMIYAIGAISSAGTASAKAQILPNGIETSPGNISDRNVFGYAEKGYIAEAVVGITETGRTASSATLSLAPGEWAVALTPGSNADVAGQSENIRTSFMMYEPESDLRRALIRMTVDQYASEEVNDLQILWGQSVYDTYGFWTGEPQGGFVVPEGISRIHCVAGLGQVGAGPSCSGMEIRVNGQRVAGNLTYPNDYYNAATGPLAVTPGDLITVHGLDYSQYRTEPGFSVATPRTYETGTSFLYVEEAAGRSALVELGDDVENPPDGVLTQLEWTGTQFDDLGYWDATNPERLTVITAGWHQVGGSLFAGCGYTNDIVILRIDRFTADGDLIERFEDRAASSPDKFLGQAPWNCEVNLQSQHMFCAAGEYFIAYARSDNTGVSNVSAFFAGTRFWIRDFKGLRSTDTSSALGEYLGHPLLNHCAKLGDGSFAENVQHLNNMIDNGIALPFFDTNVETPRQIFGSAWQTERGLESYELRRAFYELRGRQTAFWAPLWTRGMRPVVTIGAADTTITIPHIGYAEQYPSEHIFIRDSGGNVYARAVTSSVNNGDGTETLRIDSPLGVTLPTRDVRSLSRLLFCRILADRIEIQHRAGVGPKIVLPLEEVPFFTDDYLSPSIPPESDLGSDDGASDDVDSELEGVSDDDLSDIAESDGAISDDGISGDGASDEVVSDDILSDETLSDDTASDDGASDDEASDEAGSDPEFANVITLLHLDGSDGGTTFTDSSPVSATWSATGLASTRTAEKKFGTAALELLYAGTNAGNYISATNAALSLGTGDFTIEAWVYPNTLAGFNGIYMIQATDTGLYANSTDLLFYSGGSVCPNLGVLATGAWQHVAVTRESGTIRVFHNGVNSGTPGTRTNNYNGTTHRVGGNLGGGERWRGKIDEVRVTKGVARYTANFTPPAAPFPDA